MSDAAVATPRVGEIEHRPVVLHHGNPGEEYAAIRNGAIVVDRGYRSRRRFLGPSARATLTGLVTNDVAALTAGSGLYAAALTPKGKIVADLRVFAEADAVLVDCAPRAAAGWADVVRKYVNPRVTPSRDESGSLADVGVFGPRAANIAAAALGIAADALLALPAYSHLAGTVDDSPALAARVPDLGIDGYDIFVPTAARDALWDRLTAAGAIPAGLAVCDIARIEAGRPEWGLDIDETTIPQEANFDELGAISYTKGCYTGQETVARIHFRGHVNRHLRGLRFGHEPLPPLRAPLAEESGKAVGDVRSAAGSPRFGPIALGMVRREVATGATVVARWDAGSDHDGGTTTATVVALPFVSAHS
jgi:tRNA-modifying protein YgfZ